MDPRNQDNHLKKYDEKSLEKLQSKLVFNNPAFHYIFKKTEKIVAALYLITDLISDNDPIKWQVRKNSLSFMSDTLNLIHIPLSQHKKKIINIVTKLSETISLLKIASISNHVSVMNYNVAQREITLLISHLESLETDMIGNGLVLPQEFFNIPEPVNNLGNNSSSATVFSGAFSKNFSHKGQYRTPFVVKDNQSPAQPKDNLKDNRRDHILRLLKVGKPLGIKDFVREIKDCSEKTIQRELSTLVENGVLKKTGERRWSLYFLA